MRIGGKGFIAFALTVLSAAYLAACSGANTVGGLALNDETVPGNAFTKIVNAPIPVSKATNGYARCLTKAENQLWADIRSGKRQPGRRNRGQKLADNVAGVVNNNVSALINPLGVGYRLTDKISALNPNAKQDAFAICGNYCGPGHPKDINTKAAPTDSLDAACRSHDACIRRKGFACSCDQALTDAILKGRSRSQLSRIEAAIVTYFASSPCDRGCKRIGQYVGDPKGYQVCQGGRSRQAASGKNQIKLPKLNIPGIRLPKW